MKRIIDGKRYDTETAECLANLPGTDDRGNFSWHQTNVWRTPRGRYFLAGRGNAMSMWARHNGNTYGPGSGIRPLSDKEALRWLEDCGHSGLEAIEKYFAVEEA